MPVAYIALDRRFISWDEKEGSAVERLTALRGNLDDMCDIGPGFSSAVHCRS